MTELEKKLTNALLMIRNHINEPEVITSIIDENIGTDKDVMLDTVIPKDEDSDHFGEEQAEGLDNLLEGLKDTPHDNRW